MGTIHSRVGIVAFAMAVAGSAWAQGTAPADDFPVVLATRPSMEQLRRGGLVLYVRHGPTDTSQADVPELKFDDCASQRLLNADGRKVAQLVGRSLSKARVPVGEVWASPMCRTRETASLAFGEKFRTDARLAYSSFLPASGKQALVDFTRQLLSEPVSAGTNRVVVGHAPNLADLMGYFLKPEGSLAVFEPKGAGQFQYRYTITPDMWADLTR